MPGPEPEGRQTGENEKGLEEEILKPLDESEELTAVRGRWLTNCTRAAYPPH